MDRLEWVASLAICSARHSNLSYPTLSSELETTTSESSKMDTDMDRELFEMQTGQSMLENIKMTIETAKGLNTLLTDRYPERECGHVTRENYPSPSPQEGDSFHQL